MSLTALLTEATLVARPVTVGIATRVRLAVAPLARLPMDQRTTPDRLVTVPVPVVPETYWAPAGRMFVTTTDVAVAGPWFVTRSVYVPATPAAPASGVTLAIRL